MKHSFKSKRFSCSPACAIAGLAVLGVLFAAGCAKKTADSPTEKTVSEKSPVAKKTKPKTKKTEPPVKTEKTVIAKKKTEPKKKERKPSPEKVAWAAAIASLILDDVHVEMQGSEGKIVLNDAKEKDINWDDSENKITKVIFKDASVEITDKHFELLRNFPGLRYIDASYKLEVTDKGIKHLEGLTQITFLYLYGTKVSDEGLRVIGKMEKLNALCLDQTKITDAGLKHLTNLPKIRKLHVRSRNKISDAGVSDLLKLKSLFELKVGGTQITAAGVKELQTLLPNCEVTFDAVMNRIK